jgi:hypothetical protein
LQTKLEAEVSASAKAVATAAGGITRLQDKDVAETVATIQRKYIENINSDAIVVACLIVLDKQEKGEKGATEPETWLQKACPKLISNVMDKQGRLLDAIINGSLRRGDAPHDLDSAAELIEKMADRLKGIKAKVSQ